MIYRLKIAFYYLEVFYSRILRVFFNIKKDESVIPKNTMYCYVYDEKRNIEEPTNGYWIKPCKYYRSMNNLNAGCTYVGFIGFHPCLGDQCKICGVDED